MGSAIDKLCYKNPDIYEFYAKVLEVKNISNHAAVLLDRTYFFPEGGGQPSDIGWMDGQEINRVTEEGGQILHWLVQPPEQKDVRLKIDKNHRLDYCQQHSGQHLISAALWNLYQFKTLSVHMGIDYTTIEVDTGHISEEQIMKIEDLANRMINQNLPISTQITPRESLSKFPLRKETPLSEEKIRLVLIPEFDCMSCCGLHCQQTGDIGLIKYLESEKIRGHQRLKWKIGKRAYRDYDLKNRLLSQMQKTLACRLDTLSSKVDKLLEDYGRLRLKNNDYENEAADFLTQDLLSQPKENGPHLITKIFTNRDESLIKKVTKKLLTRENVIFLIFSQNDCKTLWYIGSSSGLPLDFEDLKAQLLVRIEGVGGGRSPLYSGMAKKPENLESFCREFVEFYS